MDERDDAKAVPLIEQLRSIPRNAVLSIDTPNALGVDTRSIPVGRLCNEAADLLQYGNCDYWCPACYAEIKDPQHKVNAGVREGGNG